MSITAEPLDELELSNMAAFWAGARAAAVMTAPGLDMEEVAADRLATLTDPRTAAEITRAVTEILLRANKPPAEPKPDLPSRIPAQARPGGRSS